MFLAHNILVSNDKPSPSKVLSQISTTIITRDNVLLDNYTTLVFKKTHSTFCISFRWFNHHDDHYYQYYIRSSHIYKEGNITFWYFFISVWHVRCFNYFSDCCSCSVCVILGFDFIQYKAICKAEFTNQWHAVCKSLILKIY